MDRVILRECELRLRNADALRKTLSNRLKGLAARPNDDDWQTVTRPIATEALIEAEALVDEYACIIREAEATFIPPTEEDGLRRRMFVVASAKTALEVCSKGAPEIRQLILDEDALDAEATSSSRPSSTSGQ